MKVLSLFDGISVAQQALKELGVKDLTYFASEIDKYAISLTQKNHPKTIQLGDIKLITGKFYQDNSKQEIDLLIGGSPCQDLSIAKKGREGLSGSRSGLFYEYLRILKEVKPKYFVLENVNSMPADAKKTISQELFGIQPVMINAALVSAQNRKRLFWVGKLVGDTYEQVKIDLPEETGVLLKDILESGEVDRDKSYCIDASYYKGANWKQYIEKKRRQLVKIGSIGKDSMGTRVYDPEGLSKTLSANGGGWGAKTGLYIIQTPRGFNKGGVKALDGKTPTLSSSSWQENNKLYYDGIVRKLTPIECERLQSLPDNYTAGNKLWTIEKIINKIKIWDKNAVLKIAKDSQKLIWEPALNITKDIKDINLSSCQLKLLRNVIIVIEKLPQEECVVSITKTGQDMETHSIQIKLERTPSNRLLVMDIKGALLTEKNTEMLWRNILGENYQSKKLSIISILLKLITELKIYMYAQNQSIQYFIINLKELLENYSKVEVLVLRMENIYSISNTQRYKSLGNAFNCNVVKHILKSII